MSRRTVRARNQADRPGGKAVRHKYRRELRDRSDGGIPLVRHHTEWCKLRRAQARLRMSVSAATLVVADVKRAHTRATELFGLVTFVLGEYLTPVVTSGIRAGSKMVSVRIEAALWSLVRRLTPPSVNRFVNGWDFLRQQKCIFCGEHALDMFCAQMFLMDGKRDVMDLRDLLVYVRCNGVDLDALLRLHQLSRKWWKLLSKKLRKPSTSRRMIFRAMGKLISEHSVSLRQTRVLFEELSSAYRGRAVRLPSLEDFFRAAPLSESQGPGEDLWYMMQAFHAQAASSVFRVVPYVWEPYTKLLQVMEELLVAFSAPPAIISWFQSNKADLALKRAQLGGFGLFLPNVDALPLVGISIPAYTDIVEEAHEEELRMARHRLMVRQQHDDDKARKIEATVKTVANWEIMGFLESDYQEEVLNCVRKGASEDEAYDLCREFCMPGVLDVFRRPKPMRYDSSSGTWQGNHLFVPAMDTQLYPHVAPPMEEEAAFPRNRMDPYPDNMGIDF